MIWYSLSVKRSARGRLTVMGRVWMYRIETQNGRATLSLVLSHLLHLVPCSFSRSAIRNQQLVGWREVQTARSQISSNSSRLYSDITAAGAAMSQS